MAASLGGHVAVVTGGTHGIGQATVECLIAGGAAVASVDVATPKEACAALSIGCDVREPSEVAEAFAEIERALGHVTLLVNNAGVNAYFDAAAMLTEEWDAFFALDLRAAWLCTKAVLPGMLANGRGAIVNVSSIHAHLTTRGMFPYAAAKAGLLGLTRSLALEYGRVGVRVNAVCPGWVKTGAVERQLAATQDPAAALREVLAQQPSGRMADPTEVAAVIRFLLSDEASYINGAAIPVDGGLAAQVHA